MYKLHIFVRKIFLFFVFFVRKITDIHTVSSFCKHHNVTHCTSVHGTMGTLKTNIYGLGGVNIQH